MQPSLEKARVDIRKFVKIGRPGYRVTKQRDPNSGHQSMLFQVDYPGMVLFMYLSHQYVVSYHVILKKFDYQHKANKF